MRTLPGWLTVFALPLAALGGPAPRPQGVAQAATTLFVRANAGGAPTGASWTDAFPYLQDALAAAVSGDQIWVAAGVYTPTSTLTCNVRSCSFQLKGGVAVYGGFAGSETQLSQRDWAAHVTTLSGDVLGDDGPNFANNGDNSYHVVTGAPDATLDGFTISGGNANGSAPDDHGGGMYNSLASLALANITFRGNAAGIGGGMANVTSSPTLTNVTFSGNSATFGGGLENAYASFPTLTNVTFSGNSASFGGGMYNFSTSSPTLTNVVFSGNLAGMDGGGIFNRLYSSPALTNVTFSGNWATYGGGMFSDTSSPNVVNSVLWGNAAPFGPQIFDFGGLSLSTVAFSDVQGGYAGAGNLDADPLFIAPITATVAPTTTGNYRLQVGSPAIDAGDTLSVTTGADRDGNQRVRGLAVDLGAYEAYVVTLTVATAGNGSGVVTPTVGAHAYLFGAIVPLAATASLGFTFNGWSGAGCAIADGALAMNGDVACTAMFVLTEHNLYLPLVKRP